MGPSSRRNIALGVLSLSCLGASLGCSSSEREFARTTGGAAGTTSGGASGSAGSGARAGSTGISGRGGTAGANSEGGSSPIAGAGYGGQTDVTGGTAGSSNPGDGGTNATAGSSGSSSGGSAGKGGTGSSGGSAGKGGTGSGGMSSGGSAGKGGSTGSGGTAGSAGSAGKGGAGTAGTAGSGGSTCTNTTTDASNCGICGHSCLKGTCSAGICQPYLLGTIPDTTMSADFMVVSGGKAVLVTKINVFGGGHGLYQTDATTPGTPTAVPAAGVVGCVMNGMVFTQADTTTLKACSLSNCAGTTVSISAPSGESLQNYPGCDTANNELVWLSQATGLPTANISVHRTSVTGTNGHITTSFMLPNGASTRFTNDAHFPSANSDRIFYVNYESQSTPQLGYVATNIANAGTLVVATLPANNQIDTTGAQSVITNGSIVLANVVNSSTQASQVINVPLPNGVLSGNVPVFATGSLTAGVLDQSTFYGSLYGATIAPSDAVFSCPVSSCTAPTVIVRGQAGTAAFAQDSTAIYWTTQTSGQGISIWKAAK